MPGSDEEKAAQERWLREHPNAIDKFNIPKYDGAAEYARRLNPPRPGLYRKYNVDRTDGSSRPGGKHEECEYFVLDWDHDPFAIPAALAYAKACEATHPELADDLRSRAAYFKKDLAAGERGS